MDDERADFILKFPVNSPAATAKYFGEQVQTYLLADEALPQGLEYKLKDLCFSVADGNFEVFRRLYEEEPLSVVFELSAMRKNKAIGEIRAQREEEKKRKRKWR